MRTIKETLSLFINKNENLANNIYNAVLKAFNSNFLITSFESDTRTIKYSVFNNHVFIFDSINNVINFGLKKIYKEETYENILSYIYTDKIQKDIHYEFYFDLLFKINQSYLLEQERLAELSVFLNELVQKGSMSEEEKNTMFLRNEKLSLHEKKFNCTDDLYHFKLMIDFLNLHSCFDSCVNDHTIYELINPFFELYKDKINYSSIYLFSIILSCQKNDFRSGELSASYNEGDSHIWITPQNNFILSEQRVIYYCVFHNSTSFDIFFIEKDKYEEDCPHYMDNFKDSIHFEDYLVLNLENQINDESIDKFKFMCLSVKNNEIVFVNPLTFNGFLCYFSYGVSYFKETNILIDQCPVDIYSYDYQRSYYKHRFDYDEFYFICYAFLMLGGGFTYNEEKGILYSSDVEYIENIISSPSKNDISFKELGFFNPKKVSYLNKDWTLALIYLVEQLENNKPTLKSYSIDYVNQKEAFKEGISYFKEIIKQNIIKNNMS